MFYFENRMFNVHIFTERIKSISEMKRIMHDTNMKKKLLMNTKRELCHTVLLSVDFCKYGLSNVGMTYWWYQELLISGADNFVNIYKLPGKCCSFS